jgi:hypothetical protein
VIEQREQYAPLGASVDHRVLNLGEIADADLVHLTRDVGELADLRWS